MLAVRKAPWGGLCGLRFRICTNTSHIDHGMEKHVDMKRKLGLYRGLQLLKHTKLIDGHRLRTYYVAGV